jgi:gliding motility-associatede transport system auxiliary component
VALMATQRSKVKTGANAVVFAALIVFVVILGNVVLYRWFRRVDLTADHVYTLSQGSKDLVAKLPDKISVKAFISGDLQPPYSQVAQYTRDLLDEYAHASKGKFKWEAIDPGNDATIEEEATKLKVPKLRRGHVSNNKVEIGTSFFGLAFSYQGNVESIPEVNATETLEFEIDKRIRNMTQKKTKIAFATSEGELSVEAPQQGHGGGGLSIAKSTLDFYDAVPVSLTQGAKPIPDDVAALVIAGPKQPFSDRAKFVIDQFLMKGKSVAFFVDGMVLDRPQQQMQIPGQAETPQIGHKNDVGLDDLLEHYGFRIHDDYVLEPQNNIQGAVPVQGQVMLANYEAFLATDSIAKSSPLFEHLNGLVLPFTSSMELVKDKQAGLVITELATSSNRSWRQKGFFLFNPEIKLKPSDEHGPFPLAYAAEGKFKSFFAGKPYPNEKGEKVMAPDKNVSLPPGSDAPIDQAETPGRLLVVGSSRWVSDDNISLARYVPTYQVDLLFFLNSVDWLAQDKALSSIRAKAMTSRPVTVNSESTPMVLQAVNIVGVPLAFILFGLLRWRVRTARRGRAKL